MDQFDSRVDAYIEKSAEFAKPILAYIREVAHEASPLITETIKWGFPFLITRGRFAICRHLKSMWVSGFGRPER